MTVVLDTSSSLPERRLAVWQDIVCDTFVGLDCKSDMRGAFWGAVSQSRIGPVALTQVDSTAQRVFRTPSRIARASEDYVLMALGNHGVNGVFQDGREAIVSAGQFVIYDTTRPYELRFDDSFSQTIFQMPRFVVPPEGISFKDVITDFEKRLIESTLEAAGGVQKRAAELLHIKPTTLNEMIKRYDIRPRRKRSESSRVDGHDTTERVGEVVSVGE